MNRRLINNLVIVNLVVVMVWPELLAAQSACSDIDFSPCSCDGASVKCANTTIDDIQTAFLRANDAALILIRIEHFATPGQRIPANFFHDVKSTTVGIKCNNIIGRILEIDRDAFKSCQRSMGTFFLSYCNLSQSDYSFLDGFNVLTSIEIEVSSDVFPNFGQLPRLPLLTSLQFTECSGLQNPIQFPILLKGLDYFRLSNSKDLNDESMIAVLEWIWQSSSESLQTLSISENQLNFVPTLISRFQQLSKVDLSGNRITFVPSGSFKFFKPAITLELANCGIISVEPDSFIGDFSRAIVKLDGNNMSDFSSSVFEPILSQMASSGRGAYIDVNGNPFDCNEHLCGLTWLFVDNHRLLNATRNARCSNGTAFENLQPAGMDMCFKETTLSFETTGTSADCSVTNTQKMSSTRSFQYSPSASTSDRTVMFSNSFSTEMSMTTTSDSLFHTRETSPTSQTTAANHVSTTTTSVASNGLCRLNAGPLIFTSIILGIFFSM